MFIVEVINTSENLSARDLSIIYPAEFEVYNCSNIRECTNIPHASPRKQHDD